MKTPLDPDLFEVLSIQGEESLSKPFSYRVALGTDDVTVDFNALVGKSVTISITSEDGTAQLRNGVVARIALQGGEMSDIVYMAEVVPQVWLLSRGFDNKIYQNLTVIEIAEQILKGFGITDYTLKIKGTYQPREYTVQYGESSFDFLSRLMEDEGIFYFFKHEDGKHSIVITDDASAHESQPGVAPEITYKRFDASWAEESAVSELISDQQIVMTKYRATDYNFETPATDLFVEVEGAATPPTPGMYEYPGGFMTKSDGEKKLKHRIEMSEFAMKAIRGTSNVRGFIVGSVFKLINHDREELNTEYVLRSVSFTVDQSGYENTFSAFPKTVPYRPAPTARKPMIHGYQLATVVGKSGEEIWTDKYGRVKIHFPWDRDSKKDENSSCWVRVAQMWAGKAWGSLTIPRIGTEVIVCFLDGDPDRPIIVGTLYNGTQVVPYGLPDNKTRSTLKSNSSKGGEGFNELRFEDLKDSEEIFIHAQKDMNEEIKNHHVEHVGVSRQAFIATDVAFEKDAIENLVVKGNRKVTVKEADSLETHTNEGDFKQLVTKTFLLKVDGSTLTIECAGDIIIKGKTISMETTGGDFKVKSSATIQTKSSTDSKHESGTAMSLKSGTDFKAEAGTAMKLKASISTDVDGGAMLKMKSSAMSSVEGAAIMKVKGGMTMIN
jgi:type VI secretion system secreted protein VgrG